MTMWDFIVKYPDGAVMALVCVTFAICSIISAIRGDD